MRRLSLILIISLITAIPVSAQDDSHKGGILAIDIQPLFNQNTGTGLQYTIVNNGIDLRFALSLNLDNTEDLSNSVDITDNSIGVRFGIGNAARQYYLWLWC